MQLISNDLEATKLLNQQSLPLPSSLQFALSLCQAFRQSSLKPNSKLQTYTDRVHCLLEEGCGGEWHRKGDRALWASYLLQTRPPLCPVLREGKDVPTRFPARPAPTVTSADREPAGPHILLVFIAPCLCLLL